MDQPEDRATVGTDLSAELGAKTRGRLKSVQGDGMVKKLIYDQL
ncbi:MAG: hypothetical protein U9N19_04315 [Thermodesulfobacteriota bacterium]|nr:hypothetical protein [Thermodesulfobacteriota bacterium]MEA1867311.1 hypothetical protein [Thermodesulfobacteriota bacterium]